MIFIDSTFPPVTVVGVLPEDAVVPPELGCDEPRLWSGDLVLFTLVVPGRGARALAAHRDLLQWLQDRQRFIRRRSCLFAWVIEDEALRSCVRSWLAFAREPAPGGVAVFQSLRPAFEWLAEHAPPISSREAPPFEVPALSLLA